MMGDPIPGRWLSEGFEHLVHAQPALALAYDFASYPGLREGLGRWVDLYANPVHTAKVGRLWTDGRDGCNVEQLPGCIADLYTREVLQLRLHRRAGLTASAAYEEVASRYDHSPTTHGDLATVVRNEEE